MPPIALKKMEENDNTPAPHRFGMNPPMVEPTTSPSQIICFIAVVYTSKKGESAPPLGGALSRDIPNVQAYACGKVSLFTAAY